MDPERWNRRLQDWKHRWTNTSTFVCRHHASMVLMQHGTARVVVLWLLNCSFSVWISRVDEHIDTLATAQLIKGPHRVAQCFGGGQRQASDKDEKEGREGEGSRKDDRGSPGRLSALQAGRTQASRTQAGRLTVRQTDTQRDRQTDRQMRQITNNPPSSTQLSSAQRPVCCPLTCAFTRLLITIPHPFLPSFLPSFSH